MKGWVLCIVGILSATVMVLGLAWLSACGSATPSPKVADCTAQYQACVASSSDVVAYRACRSRVDVACLDGGAP